jgi:tol-pal system protein YbgF
MIMYMRLFICLFSFIFLIPVQAEDTETAETKAPVFEPISQDLSGRLDKLEKAINNKALLDMLELLESLKIEISTLRGEVEVQTHTIEQLKQKQRDLYTDVDNRIQRIESNNSATDESVVMETDDNNGETESIEEQDNTAEDQSLADDSEPVDPLKAESVYQKAFKLLKESQYDQALNAFKDFLKDYPDSAFSDNAQYWLGEANYVKQNYELAINEYQALISTYPDSQKVSHALLKIGYSYAELGNAAEAKKILNRIKNQFPGTTAARLADERLRKIGTDKEANS